MTIREALKNHANFQQSLSVMTSLDRLKFWQTYLVFIGNCFYIFIRGLIFKKEPRKIFKRN